MPLQVHWWYTRKLSWRVSTQRECSQSLTGLVLTEPQCSFGNIQYKNSSFCCWSCVISCGLVILGCLFSRALVIDRTAHIVRKAFQTWKIAPKGNLNGALVVCCIILKTLVHGIGKMSQIFGLEYLGQGAWNLLMDPYLSMKVHKCLCTIWVQSGTLVPVVGLRPEELRERIFFSNTNDNQSTKS